MADFVMKHAGAQLLQLLQAECALTPPAAKAFLEARSGVVFDPQAEYCVNYDQGTAGEHWSRKLELRIWRLASHAEPVPSDPLDPAWSQDGIGAS